MSLDKPRRIEEYILKHLQNGPALMLDLVEKLKIDRPNTTKQAVYAALRGLKRSEQIVTYKGVASINLTWLNSMVNYFNLTKINYIKGSVSDGDFVNLEDRDKIKYYFQSPIKADIFWTHALYLLTERIEKNEPVYIYNPHEWFLLARKENELELFNNISRKGHRLLLTVGNDSFLDRHVNKYFDNNFSQYHVRSKQLFNENNYYLNIIGDFLIEVWMDKKVSDKIDGLYQEAKSFNKDVDEELKRIVGMESKMKIVISRNHKKAEKIKSSLKRHFVLK
jgi:hypothetical protein